MTAELALSLAGAFPASQGRDRTVDRKDIGEFLDSSKGAVLNPSNPHFSYQAAADAC
jgi:hypothetical protein